MRPLVIFDGAAAAAETLLSDLRTRGWTVRRGWRLPATSWDAGPLHVVCAGVLRTEADAEAALLAAARGAGVVAVVDAERQLVERFYEDLSRFGRVEIGRPPKERAAAARLGREERRLLELLEAGHSVGDAARALFISRRTADRRLASARAALGVQTTAQAVVLVASGTSRDAASTRRGVLS